MRISEIEYWTISVLDRVKLSQPIEDSRVELKSNWLPKPNHVARLIAGHANAARGELILWLIGVDEKANNVVGVSSHEFSNWWSSVGSEFEGLKPSVTDVVVAYEGKSIVALLFDTSRVPFVVKNEVFNKPGGGPVKFEVPWREGTSTRSATHNDLIQILVPKSRAPVFKVTDGWLSASIHEKDNDTYCYWKLDLNVYVVPKGELPLVLPFHLCKAVIEVPNCISLTRMDKIRLSPAIGPILSGGETPHSVTVKKTTNELLLYGPGKINVEAEVTAVPPGTMTPNNEAKVTITLMPADPDTICEISLSLAPTSKALGLVGKWSIDNWI